MKQLLNLTASFALTAAMLFTTTQIALAHAELEKAEPAPNSKLTEAPKQIKLTFSEELQAAGNSIVLLDAKGAKVDLTDVKLDPADATHKTLIAGVPKLASGAYTVQWKNLSVDGHSEKDSYKFTLAVPNVTGDVTLRFGLMAGDVPVSCGVDIKNLGSSKSTAQIMDARMYLTSIRLIGADGKETPLILTPDNKWQSDKVALLDFENGTGKCRDTGNADMNDKIVGKVPAGTYTGIAFDLGLPFEMNHADVATSKTPLNVQALWWNWQYGYKFARIDLATNSPAPNDQFLIHLGSTGCGDTTKMDAGNVPPKGPCKNPNLMSVRLNNFDPSTAMIVADLVGLLKGVNVAHSKPQPAGCMSGIDDPDCTKLFPNFGLELATGKCVNACRGQALFRVAALRK